jgi:hypothetical protein
VVIGLAQLVRKRPALIKPEIHYRFHKITPLNPNLDQLNPVQTHTSISYRSIWHKPSTIYTWFFYIDT